MFTSWLAAVLIEDGTAAVTVGAPEVVFTVVPEELVVPHVTVAGRSRVLVEELAGVAHVICVAET